MKRQIIMDPAAGAKATSRTEVKRSRRPAPHKGRRYELTVELIGGPVPIDDLVLRRLRLSGTCCLEELSLAIEQAFDRTTDGVYEFMFGAPYDRGALHVVGGPAGDDLPADTTPDSAATGRLQPQHACSPSPQTTTLDDLKLETRQTFGYLADDEHEWIHRITVTDVSVATAPFAPPKTIARVGDAPDPPDWQEEDSLACLAAENEAAFPLTDLYGPYIADKDMDPREWLDLEELEGLLWVMEAHAQSLPAHHPPVESLTLHAAIHTLAETQLALQDTDFQARLQHLLEGGLSRHEALHRLGEQLVRSMLHEAPAARPSKSTAGSVARPKNLQN